MSQYDLWGCVKNVLVDKIQQKNTRGVQMDMIRNFQELQNRIYALMDKFENTKVDKLKSL